GHLSLSAALSDAKKGTKKFIVPHSAIADKHLSLNPEIPVTPQTPPTFLLQAEDDHVDNVDDSLAYYIALKKAGVPVEMHLYAQGGHMFGLRRTKLHSGRPIPTSASLPPQFRSPPATLPSSPAPKPQSRMRCEVRRRRDAEIGPIAIHPS